MNDEDMDVTAPPSNSNFDKEYEIAQRLNDYLGQLIDSGAFDDCASRGKSSTFIYTPEESSTNYTPN